jgi:hypothetical protein
MSGVAIPHDFYTQIYIGSEMNVYIIMCTERLITVNHYYKYMYICMNLLLFYFWAAVVAYGSSQQGTGMQETSVDRR